MKIATWNINSVRARLGFLMEWLERQQPDLLCLQETKVTDEDFPRLELEAAGYRVEVFGQKSYNGVAIIAHGDLDEVSRSFSGDPLPGEARVLGATFAGIRVITVYVPNGRSVGTETYTTKLTWLDRFRKALDAGHSPKDPIFICGDWNVAPEDRDVHDPKRWRGKILCSEPEREKFRALEDWGLRDAVRLLTPDGGIYTWWDYRMSGFRRDWGLRIDHALVSEPVAAGVREATVDREARGGEKPSDHAPLVVTLE